MDNAQIVAALSVLTWESKLIRDQELTLLAKTDIKKAKRVHAAEVRDLFEDFLKLHSVA
jgi:uncharacterized protein involved in tolerance to divalent cations